MANLTKQQLHFISNLFSNGFNGTQAAIDAKYSKKTAESQASRLLTNVKVKEEIARRQNKISKRTDITEDKIANEYAEIAFGNIGDIVDFDERDLRKEIPRNKLSMVESVSFKESFTDSGASSSFKIKNYNKLAALDKLAEYIGFGNGKGNDPKNRAAKSERILGLLQAISERRGGKK